jgi:hypothetical protein
LFVQMTQANNAIKAALTEAKHYSRNSKSCRISHRHFCSAWGDAGMTGKLKWEAVVVYEPRSDPLPRGQGA